MTVGGTARRGSGGRTAGGLLSGRPVGLALRGLEWVVIISATFLLGVCVAVPRLAGAEPYVVLSSSMEPAYPIGTMVVVRPVEPEGIRTGDVITYQLRSGEPETVTHRVVGLGSDGRGEARFVTRGDANDVADPEAVRPVQVRGEVWYAVPFVGHLFSQIEPSHRKLVENLAIAGLLAYAIWMFSTSRSDRKRGVRGDGTTASAAAPGAAGVAGGDRERAHDVAGARG